MGTLANPAPDRPRDESDQYDVVPRLITAGRVILLVLLVVLAIELAL
jgi:hypothetical protein